MTVKEDGIVELPEDLLKETGWQCRDTLHWIDNKDGSWTLIKEEDLTNFIKKGIISNEQN